MRTIRGNAISDTEPTHTRPDLNDLTDIAVAERERLIQLAAHRVERSPQTVRPDALENHTDPLRLESGLLQQICPSELHERPFGPGGHDRHSRLDQQCARLHLRERQLHDARRSVRQALCYLLHYQTSVTRQQRDVRSRDTHDREPRK